MIRRITATLMKSVYFILATLLIIPSFLFTSIPLAEASIAGATLATATTFNAGTTLDIAFTVTNPSPDSEYILEIDMDFPAGVTVNSATNFMPSPDHAQGGLIYNGATGDGAQVNWVNPSWDAIYDGETGSATVNVTVDPGFTGDMSIPFQLTGDNWNAAPHIINGSVTVFEAISGYNVDTKEQFNEGTFTGALTLDDIVRVETTLEHSTGVTFNDISTRRWETEVVSDQIQLQNERVSYYGQNSIIPTVLASGRFSNGVRAGTYDPARQILIIPTAAEGLFVIATQGTSDQSDDILVANYKDTNSIGSSVTLTSLSADSVSFDGNYMYARTFGTSGGIDIIDTKGTFLDASDDTFVQGYTTSSTPPLPAGFNQYLKDSANNLIYMATSAGIYAYNDQGTPGDISDDISLGIIPGSPTDNNVPFLHDDHIYIGAQNGKYAFNRNADPQNIAGYTSTFYGTATTPALSSQYASSTAIDGDYLFIRTNAGINVINLGSDGVPGGTLTAADTIVTTYGTSNLLPALGSNGNVRDITFDSANNRLFVLDYSNLYIIDFGADTVPGGGDDVLTATYGSSASSTPSLAPGTNSYMTAASDGTIVVTSGTSVTTFTPPLSSDPYPQTFKTSGEFISEKLLVASTPHEIISHTRTLGAGQTVELQTRASDGSAYFEDNLMDGVAPITTGTTFNTVNETATGLSFTDSLVCTGTCVAAIELSPTADAFAAGSIVTSRFRFVSGSGSSNPYIRIGTDNGESYMGKVWFPSDTWYTLSHYAAEPFSTFNIELSPENEAGGHVGDFIEVESLTVTAPDSSWGPWSSTYADPSGEVITTDMTGMKYFQYRVNETTTDISTTPTVDSITLSDSNATAQYTSKVFDSGQVSTWTELNSNAEVPAGSSLGFFTRTGNTGTPDGTWSSWSAVNSPIASPNGRYLQFRADFLGSNTLESPQLDSVTVLYGDLVVPTANNSNSTLLASPTSIIANGATTSTVTATIRDGSNVLLPGQAVVINTSAGSISSVVDNGDGTYTAILTSSTTAETATLSYTVNGDAFTGTASVIFTAVITVPGIDNATILPATLVSEETVTISIVPDQGITSPITSIRYTTDESVPHPGSALYAGPFLIEKKGTTVINWKAYNVEDSELDSGSEHYYLPNTNITPTCHFPTTQQCYGPQSFTFTTAESDEKILYTTDNTHPFLDDPIYTEPDPNTEEFFAGAKEVSPGDTLHIGENIKVRFASRNRFGQISPIYYRHSVLNFPHVLTIPDPGANAHMLGFNYAGTRTEAPNFIMEDLEKNGASMATGDLNGDGRDEIIVAAGKGETTDMYIYSYHKDTSKNETKDIELILLAYKKNIYENESIKTGLSITTADINGNGREEILTVPKEGAESHVLVFEYKVEQASSGPSKKYIRRTTDANFLAYGFKGDYVESYTRGVEIAAADLDGNGTTEIITASDSGQIRIFDKRGNQTFSLGFHPYGKLTRRALHLTTADVTGDGIPEIVTIPKKGNPHVLFVNRFGKRVFTPNFVPGVNKGQEENSIAAADIDFDGKKELLIQDKDFDGKPVIKIFDPETQQAKPFQIKPNYPGYTGGLTVAVGLWSGNE